VQKAKTPKRSIAVSRPRRRFFCRLAVLYSEQLGQLDKASELAKKAREVSPSDAHAADTLGWILFKKGDYGNALPLLQERVSKLPDLPEIQFHAGMAHYMMGEERPARFALEKAVDASANFPGKDEARQRLGLLEINVGTANPGVRTELENYLRKWPNDPAVLVRLAAIQERDGALDQALKTYEKLPCRQSPVCTRLASARAALRPPLDR
jgi:tetratricopeptide (TPR) repeat protein